MSGSIKWMVIIHVFCCLVLTVPLQLWLKMYEYSFFRKQTYLYVLVFISINTMYCLLLVGIFLIFRAIGRKNKGQDGKILSTFISDIDEIFTLKDIIGLCLFKSLPLCELLVAFFGEWLALFIEFNLVILFCAIYPLLMGAI